MAQRFTFSTKDLFFVTTICCIILGWIISDLQRQKEPKAILRQWSKERRDDSDRYQRAMHDHTENIGLKQENKALNEQIEQLR